MFGLFDILRKILFFTGYFANGSYPKPLSAEEEAICLEKMQNGSKSARDKLICHNMRLVAHIAKKYGKNDLDDLISIGSIGLIKGVESYSKSKGTTLATYLARCIENEILMYIRKNSGHHCEVSIDEPLNVDWDGNELLLSDILGSEEDTVSYELEQKEERRVVREAVAELSPRERELIELRYGLRGGDEMTQKEVADLLGISQSYISRLEKRILSRLKTEIAGKI